MPPGRPWGSPRRTERAAASAGSAHERAALRRAAQRKEVEARNKRERERREREKRQREKLERERKEAKERLKRRIEEQKAARQRIAELKAAKREQAKLKKDDTAGASAAHRFVAERDIDKELHQARTDLAESRKAKRGAGERLTTARERLADVEQAGGHKGLAKTMREDKEAIKAEARDRELQQEQLVKTLDEHGYKVVFQQGERGTMNARKGKIAGVVDKYGEQIVLTPDEMKAGAFYGGKAIDWSDPAMLDAVRYDPHNPNGTKFVDDRGRTGYWEGKGKNATFHAYNFDDFYNSSFDDSLPKLKAFHGQGVLFYDDDGETWMEEPKLGPMGMPEGGTKMKGTYRTYGEQIATYAAMEHNDPDALKELQMKLFQAGYLESPRDGYTSTGIYDAATDKAVREFLMLGTMEGALTNKDLNTWLDDEVQSAAINFDFGGGGGGGGGGAAASWSATDPTALRLYAEQAARAVLGRNPTETELASAVSQVQAAETASGQQQSGGIVNPDPQAMMVEHFRQLNPAEFQAKNLADAVGMFSKMLGEGGLLGSGLAASSINQGNGA